MRNCPATKSDALHAHPAPQPPRPYFPLFYVKDTLLPVLALIVGNGCTLWGVELSNIDGIPKNTGLRKKRIMCFEPLEGFYSETFVQKMSFIDSNTDGETLGLVKMSEWKQRNRGAAEWYEYDMIVVQVISPPSVFIMAKDGGQSMTILTWPGF